MPTPSVFRRQIHSDNMPNSPATVIETLQIKGFSLDSALRKKMHFSGQSNPRAENCRVSFGILGQNTPKPAEKPYFLTLFVVFTHKMQLNLPQEAQETGS